jgi:hypothetical protein
MCKIPDFLAFLNILEKIKFALAVSFHSLIINSESWRMLCTRRLHKMSKLIFEMKKKTPVTLDGAKGVRVL